MIVICFIINIEAKSVIRGLTVSEWASELVSWLVGELVRFDVYLPSLPSVVIFHYKPTAILLLLHIVSFKKIFFICFWVWLVDVAKVTPYPISSMRKNFVQQPSQHPNGRGISDSWTKDTINGWAIRLLTLNYIFCFLFKLYSCTFYKTSSFLFLSKLYCSLLCQNVPYSLLFTTILLDLVQLFQIVG